MFRGRGRRFAFETNDIINYRIISVHKCKRRFRKIYIPSGSYKTALRNIANDLDKVLFEHDIEKINYAFVKGRNCPMHAFKHIGYQYTLSLDLEDFFDSIRPAHVKKYMSHDQINFCFIDKAPRQGLPTSPVISNLAFIECDKLILEQCRLLDTNITFTRYADDLVFSFNELSIAKALVVKIELIVRQNGFKLNKNKTKLQSSKAGRRVITGVAVDETIHATRKSKKKIRAACHQKNLSSLKGLEEWAKLKFPNKIKIDDGET